MALVSISAHDIDIGGVAVDAELPVAWLDEELAETELRAEKPGHVTARLSRSGQEIVVRGSTRADLVTPCARCLQPAKIHVDTELSLLLKPVPTRPGEAAHRGGSTPAKAGAASPKAASKAIPGADRGEKKGKGGNGSGKEIEYEFASEEADVDTYDGETVVLDPFIREAILLEIPNFPLCQEDCPGIAPAPQTEAQAPEAAPPIDPRLAPLGALRAKLSSGTVGAAEPSAREASQDSKKKKKE